MHMCICWRMSSVVVCVCDPLVPKCLQARPFHAAHFCTDCRWKALRFPGSALPTILQQGHCDIPTQNHGYESWKAKWHCMAKCGRVSEGFPSWCTRGLFYVVRLCILSGFMLCQTLCCLSIALSACWNMLRYVDMNTIQSLIGSLDELSSLEHDATMECREKVAHRRTTWLASRLISLSSAWLCRHLMSSASFGISSYHPV